MLFLLEVYTHINPRLFPDEIVYIVNHAEDKILFVDTSYIAILIGHQHLFETVEHVYLVGPKKNEVAAKMNGFKLLNDLVEDGDENYSWPELNENDAAVLILPARLAILKAFCIHINLLLFMQI